MVTIMRQMLIRQIIKRLRLRFYGWGVVIEEDDVYRGWIEIDTPRCGVDGLRKRKKFYGAEARSKHKAMESASDAAVEHLVFECNVIVRDLNYDRAVRFQERCACAEDFNNMFMDVIQLKEKQVDRMYAGYTELFAEARRMCRQFSDILPVGFANVDGPSGRSVDAKVVYGGVRPPVSSLDKLAFALVALIDRGTDLLRLGEVSSWGYLLSVIYCYICYLLIYCYSD